MTDKPMMRFPLKYWALWALLAAIAPAQARQPGVPPPTPPQPVHNPNKTTDEGLPPVPPRLADIGTPAVSPEAQPGDEVVAVFLDGDRIEGELVSRDERTIVLKVGNVRLTLERARLERLFMLDPPPERYRRMRAMIAPGDADRLVMLADWLRQRRMYAESLAELDRALLADPTNGEALRLKKLVVELSDLAGRSHPGGGSTDDAARSREEARSFPTRPKPADFPLLSPEDINLIKVYEVDLRDPPKMTVSRETVERFLTRYGDSPLLPETREGREAFYRRSPAEILDSMFRLRAREMYARVEVTDQPRSMKLFRDNVHAAWLVTGCASTACHGGSDAGRLQLFNYRSTAEASLYTNFLIMDRFKTRDGKPLIDYEEPEQSIFIQYGLPRDDARTPHPHVPGWSPAFRNRDARRFGQAIEWVRSMYRPRPAYPIEYTPPGTAKETPGEAPEKPIER